MINEEDFHDPNAIKYAMSSITSGQRAIDMSKFRSGKYKDYDLVKSWDDKSKSNLYVTGDTAVFVFDSFVNEAVYNLKWSLDYAKEKDIKRFVIDLSCNSGGNAAVVMYIMAMITNKNKDSYVTSYRKIQTLTGNITRVDNDVDLNLDGDINDLDKSVYYDFEYAFITSNISYSCGNLLPCLAKDAGFPILGERSGGGACSLLIAYTPETFFYTLSSYNKFITKDNKDVDNGAELDYDLTKQASDGNSIDYSGLYDVAAYSKMIDEFYGVKPADDPAKPVAKKKANPIKVTAKTKTVKLKKVKKAAQKAATFTVKKAQGKLSFKIKSAKKAIKKYLTISKKGVLKIKRWKKAKKGTYTIKVTVKATGNKKYKSKSVDKTVKVKVK